MERRIRIVGLWVVVAFALGAVITTGAQASTEIVNGCIKVEKGANRSYHGHYLDKRCTVEATAEEIDLGGKANKYELGVGAKWSSKGQRGQALKLLSAQGEIECTKSAGSGTVLGPTRVQASLRFAKCADKSYSVICTTPGLTPGTIETKPLLGVIGENPSKEVFVSLTGKETDSTEPAPAATFAEIDCGELITLTLHGTLAGRWTGAVNTPTKSGGMDFAAGTGEQDLIEQFVDRNEPPGEEATTLEAVQSLKFKVNYEIKQG
jgi:hypothetical protein